MKTRSIISASAIAVSFLIAGAANAIDSDSYYTLAGTDPLVYEANEDFDTDFKVTAEESEQEEYDWTPAM